jgi:hypothetical protein
MSKLATLINERFRKKEKPQTPLVPETMDREKAAFSNLFGIKKLGEQEREELSELLQAYKQDASIDCTDDLRHLVAITSEVKAINNQAAILHGERIKTAQDILKKYREGAFTAWLKATYGNRQTPYNFLQYFLFYTKMPEELQKQVESMPRQAIYTLASRQGELEKKQEVVREYRGESKLELLTRIRSLFPLDEKDGRRENFGESSSVQLRRLCEGFERNDLKLTADQKRALLQQLKTLESLVKSTETI